MQSNSIKALPEKRKKSIMGNGYGSECHLLRWMGRHRCAFDKLLIENMSFSNGASIQWLDFEFDSKEQWPDAELKGLEFLKGEQYLSLQKKWKDFWPLGGGIHNWDAVGWIIANGKRDLLLVEAKAHTNELISHCGAKSKDSIDKIIKAFDQVKSALNVPADKDWTKLYYQFTNRVATLHFLKNNGINANMLFIYFIGDKAKGKICPKSEQEWEKPLKEQSDWVGLPQAHPLQSRIHKIFMKVDAECLDK